MHIRIVLIVLLSALTGCATNRTSDDLLISLATQLHSMRNLPMNTPTNAKCPRNKDSLIGLSSSKLQDTLGEPDYIDDKEKSRWYFFTSPTPPLQFGGGFPQLGFALGKDQLVTSVSCYGAR